MYSDGNRKTLSELQREVEATRGRIADEAHQLERITKAMAKTQFSIDQLFRLFAREVTTEQERNLLVDVLESNYPDVHMENLPLIPIATTIASGRLSNARRIFAADNMFIDDSALIFFVHVLRFSPQASQIDYVDISGTRVTDKGMFFMLEMIAERERGFTLVARRLRLAMSAEESTYYHRYRAMLATVAAKRHCELQLDQC